MIVFWDVALCSLANVYRRSSEMLINVYQTRRRHIPDYGIVHSHSRETLKSNNFRMIMIIRIWMCRTYSMNEGDENHVKMFV
jgi:hypothetical protein